MVSAAIDGQTVVVAPPDKNCSGFSADPEVLRQQVAADLDLPDDYAERFASGLAIEDDVS